MFLNNIDIIIIICLNYEMVNQAVPGTVTLY
jgi:hypothetical protein